MSVQTLHGIPKNERDGANKGGEICSYNGPK
jgi:hypothetical protein